MTTKNLRFRSANLGADIRISLSFTPPTATLPVSDEKYPWKSFLLAAKGETEVHLTWVDKLGFCAPKPEKNYVSIAAGQGTILMGTPPVTFFTIPVPIPGVKTVQVMNQTTGPSHIGLGYIVDGQMSPAAIWENVQKNALLVSQTPEPILRAFVEVQGAEAPSPGDPHSAPIWQQDLLSLSTNTMVMISPDNHGWYDALTYSMDEGGKPVTPTADGVVAPAKPDKADESEEEVTSETETDDGARGAIPQSDDHWKVRIYRAEVAFEDAGVVPKAARVICGQLSRKGYVANVVQKDREVYATIAMTVLHGGSCAQAEKDLLSVLDSEDLRMEAPNVKAHDGLAMVSGGQGRDAIFSHWRPITPCDSEWW